MLIETGKFMKILKNLHALTQSKRNEVHAALKLELDNIFNIVVGRMSLCPHVPAEYVPDFHASYNLDESGRSAACDSFVSSEPR